KREDKNPKSLNSTTTPDRSAASSKVRSSAPKSGRKILGNSCCERRVSEASATLPSVAVPRRCHVMERSAEPLQSRSANARRRDASGGGAALKKKKKRRRRRRRTPKEEEGRVALVSPTAGCGEPFTPARGPPTPVLRPVGAQVPRAPENSTQFIMDDHENSALFLNFDKSTPGWEHDPPASGGEDDLGSATPTHAHTRDWYPFNLADFESAYRSAREDRLMGGSRTDLCAAIVALEARAAVLTEALSASPSRLVATLQAQLLTLQEENAALRQRLARRRKQVVPRESSSSSTDSDSESDSTNSSSDCSESDCDTCAARRSRSEREEEKENTRPAVISPPTTP
ncbi:uncharacterized protein LOC134787257, partial [Penaeus indicus]|uniref:uncharacterized protein LOC134787257 n=1 Tax=Penaeus indicus TaxID=29960 RepID=UPI00300D3821